MFKQTLSISIIFIVSSLCIEQKELGPRPIIGVISAPSDFPEIHLPDLFSNIHGSVISFIEAGGARVTPIPWDVDEDKLFYLLSSVNGIIIDAESTQLYKSNLFGIRKPTEFTLRMVKVLSYVLHMNEKGIYFPMVGLNSAFVAISALIAEDMNVMEETNWTFRDKPRRYKINLKNKKNKIFSMLDFGQLDYLQSTNALSFYNIYKINQQTFQYNLKLRDFFTAVATYKEDTIEDYVAVCEANKYPIYLIQFSPQFGHHDLLESNDLTTKYISNTVYTNLANFLVQESRQNNNSFPDREAEDQNLIYNFKSEFIDLKFPRIYFFNKTNEVKS